jgi:hypothetical protein
MRTAFVIRRGTAGNDVSRITLSQFRIFVGEAAAGRWGPVGHRVPG